MVTRKRVQKTEDDFIENVKSSLDDAEQLLREAAESTGEKADELRESALRSLRLTRDSLYDAQDALVEKGRQAARATDDYVHDNPWQAIGCAGLAGLLLGVLISRR